MQAVKKGVISLDIGGTLSKLAYITHDAEALLPHNHKLRSSLCFIGSQVGPRVSVLHLLQGSQGLP